jgi:hypothetical protein
MKQRRSKNDQNVMEDRLTRKSYGRLGLIFFLLIIRWLDEDRELASATSFGAGHA